MDLLKAVREAEAAARAAAKQAKEAAKADHGAGSSSTLHFAKPSIDATESSALATLAPPSASANDGSVSMQTGAFRRGLPGGKKDS